MIDLLREDGLWIVRLDRADKANALTATMLAELAAIAAAAATDDRVAALVLTGAGDRAFSGGADLAAAGAGLATDPVWERLSAAIAALPCLTIAALNGTVAGGAFGMVLACDLRLAVPGARFFYPVAKLGFLPQPSDPRRMAALIGPARTRMMMLAGARIDAAEARDWGLVDRIAEEPLAAARALAADATAIGRAHLAAIKALC